jgi:hypothetical protein
LRELFAHKQIPLHVFYSGGSSLLRPDQESSAENRPEYEGNASMSLERLRWEGLPDGLSEKIDLVVPLVSKGFGSATLLVSVGA